MPTVEKRKKRKPTKLEQRIKLVEAVPVKDRWWTTWSFQPSHTVASMVSETPGGSITEEIWDARRFEANIRRWMAECKEQRCMAHPLFQR
jgi:hypothetical protein